MEGGREQSIKIMDDTPPSILFVILFSLPFWVIGFIIYGMISVTVGLVIMWVGTALFCFGLIFWLKKNI